MAETEEEQVQASKFSCPKPVILLCLAYGIVLGLHYSILVAKPLYVTEDLMMGKRMGVFLSHFPAGVRLLGGIIAAVLADSYFGKFNIMATSYVLVFFIPGPLVIISTWYIFSLQTRKTIYIVAVTADLIVGFGTVVHPAFIAEQFKMPEQQNTLQTYYTFDYLYYNICVVILEFVTLEYTFEMSCLGGPKCYQIVFISYYISYGVALFLFLIMKRWYTIRMPERSVVKDIILCIWTALKNRRKMKGRTDVNYTHWLDLADCFDQEWRDDLRRIGRMLTMLFPYFVYNFLYAQMNSMWIYQACRLDGRITESWTLKPSQVETLNPIVIVTIAPIVEFVLYPVFEKKKFLNTPLQRIGLAYTLTIFAFIMAAVLQIYINKNGSPLFTLGKAQFRIFNGLSNETQIKSDWVSGGIKPYRVAQALEVDAVGIIYTKMDINLPNGNNWTGFVTAEEGKGINYIINDSGVTKLNQELDSSLITSLRPSLLVICSNQCEGKFYVEYNIDFKTDEIDLKTIQGSAVAIKLRSIGRGKFYINDKMITEQDIKDGGLYGVVIYKNNNNEYEITINTLLKPNSITIGWIFPQYITITIAELFLFVATNMFIYTQSPPSLRSIVRGLYSAGNSLAQISLGAVSLVQVPEVIWFFSLAGFLLLATIIHIIMANRYQYQKAHD